VERVRRLIFIVARDRKDLFASLSRTFAGDDLVDIVIDRRTKERRRTPLAPETERRRKDRRIRDATDRRLRARGYAVIAVIAPRRARTARRTN
jgi:hypothetical protein